MKMLEKRVYTKAEMVELLGTKSRQGIKRKLDGYAVDYSINGRGKQLEFEIKEIKDPFKIFCILNLEVPPQTDFSKLCIFYYYFFCGEEFKNMPDEEKEAILKKDGINVSRQSIAKYIGYLDTQNWIAKISDDCVYYFAYKEERRVAEKEEYCKAWREYWAITKGEEAEGNSHYLAIDKMIQTYGGIAKKYAKPKNSAFFLKEINMLVDLVCDRIEKTASD